MRELFISSTLWAKEKRTIEDCPDCSFGKGMTAHNVPAQVLAISARGSRASDKQEKHFGHDELERPVSKISYSVGSFPYRSRGEKTTLELETVKMKGSFLIICQLIICQGEE